MIFRKRKLYYQGPKSDHFNGERFFNPWNPQTTAFHKALLWKATSKRKHWPRKKEDHLLDTPPKHVEGDLLRVSFIGHSTMLIQTQGLNIITDPILSKRASPFKRVGPKRVQNPGISLEKLPKIDLILISHNHYDHLDISTVKKIWERDQPQIIAPLGNDVVIQDKASSIKVDTLDWHQSMQIDKNVTIHLVPAQHWSARNYFDKNKALWGAFVVATSAGNIYFSGDSGYGDGHLFREVYEKYGAFRFAMLPIGAYEPRWLMHYAHMNPEEAVLAYKHLGNPHAAAIHFETFRLADEGFEDPTKELEEACEKHGVSKKEFRALKIGEAWMVP